MLTRVEQAGRRLVRKFFPRQPASDLDYDPYDKTACEARAERLLGALRKEAGGTPVEICQRLLAIIEDSYPTDSLAADYFANLALVLDKLPRLERPGQLVIGLGPGRCGSTSLSAMLATVANSCCTHETPPPISWAPQAEQIDFHIKRFRMLADCYALVSDVSHWWLNAIDQVFDHFPDAKGVGLIRDPEACAKSFVPIQGYGKGSFNPWATPRNGVWRSGQWDPSYPSYPSPSDADQDPDRAKLELITRYVTEYNAKLETLAREMPERIKLVRTEELSLDTVQDEIFELAKARGQTSEWKLNVKGIADGKKNQIKF